jgi:hypothetical protein
MNRRPLVPRQPLLAPPAVPHKRPRSPDPAALPPRKHRRDRDPVRLEREQQRLEFKEKYSRAFPVWTFYLDGDTIDSPGQLESFRSRILQLGAVSTPPPAMPPLTRPPENRPLLLAGHHASHLQRTQPPRLN